MKDIELPPLPDADVTNNTNLLGYRYSYSAILMQSYARAAVEDDRAQRVPDDAISGALFDFAGFLTTLDAPVRFGSTEDAAPMVELLQKFAKKRGLSLDDADVMCWSALLASTPAPAQQERGPMTPDGLADECETWLQAGGASNVVDAFEAGFRLAERHHGIKE